MPHGHLQEAAKSPCINVCALDDSRTLCIGCFRTLGEITAWSRVDEAERMAILAACSQRKATAGQVPPPQARMSR